jgi:hypothetical protein
LPDTTKINLIEHYDQVEKPLRIYQGLSAGCLVLDTVFGLILLVMAGLTEYKLVWLSQLFIVTIYFYADLWLILYAVHFNLKVPTTL